MNLMDSNNTIWKVVRAVCLHLLLAIQACTPSLGLSQPEFVFSAFFGYMVSIIGSNNALQISDVVESDKSRISKNIVKVANVGFGIVCVIFLIRTILIQYRIGTSGWMSIFMIIYGLIIGSASSASLMMLDKKYQFD